MDNPKKTTSAQAAAGMLKSYYPYYKNIADTLL
jgi:hypothetical protein